MPNSTHDRVVGLRHGLVCLFLIGSTLAAPHAQQTSPRADIVGFPVYTGANAIWGATGQDSRGHIWFGVSGAGAPWSAHLYEYDPQSGTATDRGSVMEELTRAGVLGNTAAQEKIHSKIVQAEDGFLYFSSMNESDEDPATNRLPTWGGRLWRLSTRENRWEHLMSTPEALIAVGTGGRYVYALGYFGHVLYQFNTTTGAKKRVEVGSVDGHISRNFLVDRRGHAFVPRIAAAMQDGARRGTRVSIVEFDTLLNEVASTPIDPNQYFGGRNTEQSHGIVGLQTMDDGVIYFTSDAGQLFRITPPAATARGTAEAGPAAVTPVGWIHPDGPSYAASLFTPDGKTRLTTLTRRAQGTWEWISCTRSLDSCDRSSLAVTGLDAAGLDRALLYGSATRDARGGHYLVGMLSYRPLVLRVGRQP